MTRHMRAAIEESVDTHARTKDPQCVDLICDRECYADICEAAKRSGNAFVIGYVKLLIDTINLKTFVRAREDGPALELLRNGIYQRRRHFRESICVRL